MSTPSLPDPSIFFNGARVGILGATSPVAQLLIPQLNAWGAAVIAFSRQPHETIEKTLRWRTMDEIYPPPERPPIPLWLSFAPAYILTNHLDALSAAKAERVIMLSSTTRFTKVNSGDPTERHVAQSLAVAEERLHAWGESEGIDTHVLWPTLVYGNGRDKNVSQIARWIGEHGFFPLYGAGSGLRQPVHARDVADAALAALMAPRLTERGYVLSGGETLSYRAMVERIFAAMGRQPKVVSIPPLLYRAAFAIMRRRAGFERLSLEMARRMNADMVFPHTEAARDLGFTPRGFNLGPQDLPPA
ncbi:NAD-dependent epimerase/dehydratase family protein [Devosia sp. 1566]|uniref:NAD-dependent epimerase/dehydratase family protein n=1 Tax=Devosia sp. 1566 TaxID=2499144 RepID=UPI000FD6F970|nr:NAD-dependent epimerase/dehydratase family protein [Devosia sp. 1566]